MSLLIKAAAKKIRKIGEKNEGEDSILAHISPDEENLLKARGGSGELDPVTGLPHFNRETDRAERDKDKNKDGGDGGSGGGGGGGSRGDGGNDRDKALKDAEDAVRESLAKAESQTPGLDLGSKTAKSPSEAGYDPKDPGTWSRGNSGGDGGNSPSLIPTNPTDEDSWSRHYQAMAEAAKAWKASQPESEVGVKDVVGGIVNPFGPGGANLFRKAVASSKAQSDWEAQAPYGAKSPDVPRSLLEQDHKDSTPKAPVQSETEDKPTPAPVTPTPSFDDFVAKARKRKGYLSTLLSGGVSAATPQGKTLLGS